MRKTVVVIAAIAVGIALFAAARHFVRPRGSARSAASLPDLLLTDLNGNSIRTADYRGKIVVVNFWAAWCAPCAEEIPQFVALQQKYGAQGVQVLGISIDDIDSELRSFYRKYEMNYPVAAGDQKVTDAFGGVPGLPTTFVIDRESHIQSRHVGPTNFQTLERQVLTLEHQ